MMQLSGGQGRRHILTALLVVLLVAAGSCVVWIMSRNGGILPTGSYPAGTVLEAASDASGAVSIVGDNLEVTVQSASARTTTGIVLESAGFQRDLRAQRGTFGLRVNTLLFKRGGARRLTILVPEDGKLVLTLVGTAKLVLNQARLADLELTGVSSALTVQASPSGSAVGTVQIDSVAGDLTGVQLGNLNMTRFVIGSIAGNYALDFSGSLNHPCAVTLQSAFGNGVLRFAETPGVQISLGSVLGQVQASGFVTQNEKTFLNRAAASAGAQLQVRIEKAIGQIQLVEVHS